MTPTTAGHLHGKGTRLLRGGLVVGLLAGGALAAVDPFTLLFYGSHAAVGSLLVYRRPGNVIGWLLVILGWSFIGTTMRGSYDIDALRAGTAPIGEFLSAWFGSWTGSAGFALYLALTILFPTGRLPHGRGRAGAIALLVVAAAVVILTATGPTTAFNPTGGVETIQIPNQLALLGWLPIWEVLPVDRLTLLVIALLVVGIVSLLVRYRRSTGVLRLQLRWLLASIAFVAASVTFGLSTLAILGEDIGGLAWLGAIVAYPTVPASIGVAVLRYRLYEIDRIVSRTIGWVIVTAMLAAVFAGTIIGLQALLAPFTNNNTLAVAGSTLLAATLFQPLRARVQRAVDRRFNRARVDAQRAIDDFGAHLRDSLDLDDLNGRLTAAIADTMQPSRAGLWIRNVRGDAGSGAS
ncbi:MAG TPA: hypothetical protein VES19_03755 [Candidatus Limnocylindrales bacterium]|nr:hypothetical protein [Candidatus Limnocylindrales bacterium]